MINYKHILVAVDLSPVTLRIVERASEIARVSQAKISVVHVMEHSPLAYDGEFSIPINVNVEQILETDVRDALTDLGQRFHIGLQDQYVKVGSIKHIVTHLADELAVDLIVVGTHGHHGFSVLLGSRANAILHAAHCDVLAVRVHEMK